MGIALPTPKLERDLPNLLPSLLMVVVLTQVITESAGCAPPLYLSTLERLVVTFSTLSLWSGILRIWSLNESIDFHFGLILRRNVIYPPSCPSY